MRLSETITAILLPASMFGLMFGMGLALVPEDFRRIARVPGPVVTGTLLQLVGMPLVGIALASFYSLPPLLAVGLVIVAACPGGMLSNMFVHLSHANTALSITLTATATTVTLITLPLWIRGVMANVGDGSVAVEIPLLATAAELGSLTILPVLLGMIFRASHPAAARFESPLSILGSLGVVGSVVYQSASRPELPTAEFMASLAPAILLILAASGLGLFVPLLLRQSAADAIAISVELTVKNGVLGLVVAASAFDALAPTIPILVYTTFMIPIALMLLFGHRMLEKRRAAEISE